jgi:hypothetical protein
MQWLRPKAAGQAYTDLVITQRMKTYHVYPGVWNTLAHKAQPAMAVITQGKLVYSMPSS